ncbi:endonuclease/exonuclease/phosphatase family protein [uncultured Deinococcus sp.]|uniref:endonuclease/exonuclease/phosphatase family protein n=1 Tax=uncultured Deinococcus sp. TaxID=158789 RepID=UPI0025DB5DE3|nr:endonuclease/exonuclease/phosphatase family protein [uncultured Deinococcus sp.]
MTAHVRPTPTARARSVRGWPTMFGSVVAWSYLLLVAAVWALAELVGERRLPTALLVYTPAFVWLGPAPLVLLWTWWRRRGVAVALAATLLAAWGAGLLHWRPQSEGTLRVLTFNVKRGQDTTPQRLGTLLRGTDADVILLQEANFEAPGFATELRRELPGYRMLEAYETTTLTRLPVVSFRDVNYPSDWREVLVTTVTWQGQPLTVVNAHPGRLKFGNALAGDFTLMRPSLAIRRGQVGTVMDIVRAEQGRLVLGGDLNTPPRGQTYRAFLEAVGTDAHDVAGRGPGWTFPGLFARIDHQLARGLTPTRSRVLAVDQSDHRPLLVEYR